MTAPVPGWYPEQSNPHLLRWWDGYAWTPHTQPNPAAAPPPQFQPPPAAPYPVAPQQVQQQPVQPYQFHPGQPPAQPQPNGPAAPQPAAAQSGAVGAVGQIGVGPLFTDPVIRVVEDARLLGMLESAHYRILGQTGHQIGAIQQISLEAPAAKARLFATEAGWIGQSQHFQVLDAGGALVLHVARALQARSAHRPRFEITAADGQPVGLVESEKLVGRITFGFTVAGGPRVAGIKAEGMRNRQFGLTDQQDQRFAQYDREPPSDDFGDSYTVTRYRPTPEPLGTAVLTAIVALDAGFFVSTEGGMLR